jgi:hypothetical protein
LLETIYELATVLIAGQCTEMNEDKFFDWCSKRVNVIRKKQSDELFFISDDMSASINLNQ